MKFIFVVLLLLCLASMDVLGQELRWGEFGVFSKWEHYPYAIKSSSPFVGHLPDLREFPRLIELARDPKLNQTDRVILLSQMRTLSRCDFEKRDRRVEDNAAAEFRKAVQKWEAWWQSYGEGLAQSLPKTGHNDEAAWKTVAPSPYLECPKYPISIPRQWSSSVSFRSGDYGAMAEEVIEFKVNEGQCELKRRYRTGDPSRWTWTHEVWTEFTRKEADHLIATLIYAIDNPWFFAGDEFSEPIDKKGKVKVTHIRGRPKEWLNYYPSYEWSGIRNADQRVLINHDPWTWHCIDYNVTEKTSLNGVFGVVFRVVRDLFPDPSWMPSESRWKKTAPPSNWKE